MVISGEEGRTASADPRTAIFAVALEKQTTASVITTTVKETPACQCP